MCLLFLCVCDDVSEGGYKLIIADNRDEFWDRPTKEAEFWGKNGECLSGVDNEPGREGGTWLGVSKAGKAAVLLNILDVLDKDKRGRGRLVTDFLECDLDGDQYLSQNIEPIQGEFNKFNLILVDLRSASTVVSYFNNKTGTRQCLPSGIYGFDNSTMDNPWQKSVYGRTGFTKAVQDYGRKSDRDRLVEALLDVLTDKTCFTEDGQLLAQATVASMPQDITHQRSAAFVWSPLERYGTRTNTIVLVDKYGECEYIERTFKIPVHPEKLENHTKSYKFQMSPFNKL